VFIGHLALAFGAKRVVPHVSLGALMAASQLPDILWPMLVATGLEQVRIDPGNTAMTPLDFVSYPWSHSLLLVTIWAAGCAAAYLVRVHQPRPAIVLGLLVLSHWVLDAVSHRPDMPLYPGGARVGLGLWYSVPLTVVIEGAMFVMGVWVYSRSTRPVDRAGRWGFLALVAVLLLAYTANIATVPPSVTAIWVVGLSGAAVVFAWAQWVDSRRLTIVD
jgi:hypothetical protein